MQNATILVVEDDKHLLAGIRDILELETYNVITATDGEDALEKLQASNRLPDLIVSDIMMPNMDGIKLLEEVRKVDRFVSIPFIFLTARGEKTDIQRGKRLGVDDYVVKPFNADDLLVAITSRLGRAEDMQRVQEGREAELKQNILTILNHEFRTPLTFVVAYSDMLQDIPDENKNDEMLTFLEGVKIGADRLHRLIQNFITLVELETGDSRNKFTKEKKPIDNLQTLVQESIDNVLTILEHPCEVNVRLDESLPTFSGHVDYLQKAIGHLVDNACKFSEKNTPIAVEIYHQDDHVIIAVTDQGRGIPPAEHEKIWKKFYQINREHHEDQGAGSGLAIVKHITTLHGGRVSVESTPNEGSTFRLHLPITRPAVPKKQQA